MRFLAVYKPLFLTPEILIYFYSQFQKILPYNPSYQENLMQQYFHQEYSSGQNPRP
jgi:hypothetical protein